MMLHKAEAGVTSSRPDATRVFISYSRKDHAFVGRLTEALAGRGFRVLQDTADILPSEEWQARLSKLIENAHAVVFVTTGHSIRSQVCGWELETAQSLNRKIIPVSVDSPSYEALPSAIGRLNIISADDPAQFDTAFEKLSAAIETDIGWVREHTRLSELALAWEAAGRAGDGLLRGKPLAQAAAWIASPPRNAPAPTPLHYQFIEASRAAAAGRTRKLALAGVAAVALATAAGLFAYRSVRLSDDVAVKTKEIRTLSAETTKFSDSRKMVSQLMPTRQTNLDFIKSKLPDARYMPWLEEHTTDENLADLQGLSAFLAFTGMVKEGASPRAAQMGQFVWSSKDADLFAGFGDLQDRAEKKKVVLTMLNAQKIPEAQKELYRTALNTVGDDGLNGLLQTLVGFIKKVIVSNLLGKTKTVVGALELLEKVETAGGRTATLSLKEGDLSLDAFILASSQDTRVLQAWPKADKEVIRLMRRTFLMKLDGAVSSDAANAIYNALGFGHSTCLQRGAGAARRVLYNTLSGAGANEQCRQDVQSVEDCAVQLALVDRAHACATPHRKALFELLIEAHLAAGALSDYPIDWAILVEERPDWAGITLDPRVIKHFEDRSAILQRLPGLLKMASLNMLAEPVAAKQINALRGDVFGGASYGLLLKNKLPESLEAARLGHSLNPAKPFIRGNLVQALAANGLMEEAVALYKASQGLHVKFETFSDQLLIDLDELKAAGVTNTHLVALGDHVRAHVATGAPELAKSLKLKKPAN